MEGTRGSILLFGEDDALRRVLSVALSADGYAVRTLGPGADEAPAAAPDAVIYLDRRTGASPRELVQRWRCRWPRARYIELSFYSLAEPKVADLVIELPFYLDDLLRAIGAELSGSCRRLEAVG